MGSRVRVKDVAARAGVSPATVSNALSGKAGVSREVAERIRRIASELGYESPKPRGEQERQHIRMVMYKSHGLVVMDTQFFAELVESVQRECQSAGLELTISHIDAGKDDAPAMAREIRQEDCAGILLLGTEMGAEELKLFQPCRSPLVVIDNLFRHEDVDAVVMNNYDAGYKAVMALHAAGHRDIRHITSCVEFSNGRYRRKGYEAAMDEVKLPFDEDSFWRVTPTVEGAYQDMKQMLASGRKVPTAFFAGNDIMAVGCVRALQEAGFRVPDDVSIIGMDDTALGQACYPPLSTIRVYRQEMGVAAVRTLISITPQLGHCVVKTELSVDLIQRSSVKVL